MGSTEREDPARAARQAGGVGRATGRRAGKRADVRVVKTEQAIERAFATLLETTEYPQITVAAIAREAGISRKTFYAHYAGVDELLGCVYADKLRAVCEPLVVQARREGAGSVCRQFILALLQAIDENLQSELNLLRNLELARFVSIVVGPLEEIFAEERRRRGQGAGPDLHGYAVCYVGALIAGYVDWRSAGAGREPIEQLAERIYRIVTPNAAELL